MNPNILAKKNFILKALDPDYFMCNTCKEYQHVSIRCKQKLFSVGGQPPKTVPSTRPLCIPCNKGVEYWEWEIREEKDIVVMHGVDIDTELTNVIGEQMILG